MNSEETVRLPVLCTLSVAVVMVWSLILPRDFFTWFLEAFPVLLAVPLLILTYRKFRLTDMLYGLIALHMVVLLVGAHYTYAEVPLFNWLRDHCALSRNYYDRVGHFFQGLVPALIARELLLRLGVVQRGFWLIAIVLLSCMGMSALYELFEWMMAELTHEAADAFLGSQGDTWDSQKDMLLAGIGATVSVVWLAPWHDRQLQNYTGGNVTHQARW